MIASPGDVSAEREIIRAVVADWNAMHSIDKSAVLLPVAWESHAAPTVGDRPQAIINQQLLADCDLLIAAFWTRLGSPTGAAASGTVEEIEEHVSAGKPAMIYFSNAPVRLDSVDAAQYQAVQQFKRELEPRGLYETYESIIDFRDKLSRQLTSQMIRLCGERPRQEGPVYSTNFILTDPASLISSDARELLKAAATTDGRIFAARVMGGTTIQVGQRAFNDPADRRDTARWQAALRELESNGMVDSSGNGQIFTVNHRGCQEADRP